MKSFFEIILIVVFLFLQFDYIQAQQTPVWPVSTIVPNYNQINCTFTEKHSQFHGGIDINIGNDIFLAILDGKVMNNASNSDFFITHHDLIDQNNIQSNLKKVQYGDETGPLPNINPFSSIIQSQEIGEVTDNTDVHLHFEMWIRDCIDADCAWYRVDPLNNTHANYINQPPGYYDVYDVEINDVILEPQNNHSGLMFNNGNGLQNWHFNSCKIHKKDRPDSHGPTHSYYGSSITAYGDILPTIHVRDTEVTNGINSTGEGLGIFEAVYWIDDNMKYWLRFDEIENEYVDEWESFFNSKYNTITGQNILYGNHDYLKMHRLISDQYCSPHNSIQSGIWKTRLKIGYINEITDIPQNAQYNDDEYDVDFSVLDAAGNRDDANNLIKVDNFWPYIKEIKIYDVSSIPKLLTVLKRNSFEGTTAENDGYIKNSWLIPAEFVFTGGFSNIKIEVITSEPMQSMRVKNAIYTIFF